MQENHPSGPPDSLMCLAFWLAVAWWDLWHVSCVLHTAGLGIRLRLQGELMGTFEKIGKLIIPLNRAAIATVDALLKEAILALKRLYCEVEEGKCTEAGFRAILVADQNWRLVGILDFQCIIRVLFPEISEHLPDKMHALWLYVVSAVIQSRLRAGNDFFREATLRNGSMSGR
jgi:hypothetical protein